MKAIQFDDFGGPGVLHLAEVDDPHAGVGQVRVRVAAAGVNPMDYKIRSGAVREMFPVELPCTPGTDVAGIVDEVGDGVSGVLAGDEVLGWADTGSYAEFALLSKFAQKPEKLSWELAAALPVAGETARRVLKEVAVAQGDAVLIHGASGAVGSIAVQMALRLGATVIGTASETNLDYVRSLGAVPVLYGSGLVARVRSLAPVGIDAVIDTSGKGALPDSIELRGGTERIVTIADPMAKQFGVAFSVGTPITRSPEDLAELAQLVADGMVTVAIAKTLPLADAAEAHELSESGHAGGKIILIVD